MTADVLSSTSADSFRPETWFHLIGGNVSKDGLTADLEAIKAAGIGGIHLFHGQMGKNAIWPGVKEPIPCLSEKWDDMIAHAASECRRLGLTFKMQNCPGWSMSGGPWIRPENAMRNLCFSRTSVRRGNAVSLPLPELATDNADRDYRDLFVVAFPTPLGDGDGWLKPTKIVEVDAKTRRYVFDRPVTVRTLEIPPVSELDHARTYDPEMAVEFVAEDAADGACVVLDEPLPPGSWQDNRKGGSRYTLACDEAYAKSWLLRIRSKDPVRLGEVRLTSAARLEHWEGLAGWTVRGLVGRAAPRQDPRCWIDGTALTNLTGLMRRDGSLGWMPPDERDWTVLRIGHVNGLYRNGPAPAEATGWECSKLSPRGVEANYAAYIGRLAKGPVKGMLKGLVVDSWECFRDNWTDGLDGIFRNRRGYDLVRRLPSVFGWVIGTPDETASFLRDWRGLLGELVEENYYGRMTELAHADGLTVQYETAFGDALAGDLLRFWKYADVPMCEFWRPTQPTGVGSRDFKAVKPCVSAAHVYGKRRVAAEALTNCALTWDETPRDFKPVLDRHFARGVTHPVFHTYTHNPQVGFKRPGTSFGYFIGTPFLRGQSWWPFMPQFTDYCARCTEFLESGHAVVDILRVLGDGIGHKPSERTDDFGNRFKEDYVNRDVLFDRLAVRDGRLVLPDGMSYAVLWIPNGTFLNKDTLARIGEFERAGARVVRGEDPTNGLVPDVVSPDGRLLWYHRAFGSSDGYFVVAETSPVRGIVVFRGRPVKLDLDVGESRFVRFDAQGRASVLDPVTGSSPLPSVPLEAKRLAGYREGDGDVSLHFPAKRGESLVADLGRVEQCAEVWVNGVLAARLWCSPYRVEVGRFCRDGQNELRIRVTSSWYNALVRDAARPEKDRELWTLYGPKADAGLKPAGLFGPVCIYSQAKGGLE